MSGRLQRELHIGSRAVEPHQHRRVSPRGLGEKQLVRAQTGADGEHLGRGGAGHVCAEDEGER